jgi:capsular exopolysaccharide synthesis family protein
MNTAVVLAQQGKCVLLVDADLRKPALHSAFHLPNNYGLSSLLLSTSEFNGLIAPHPCLANLFVLTAGPAQTMPAELLGSSKMRELMRAWREQYDYVLLDTPPVLAVTDAIRLSSEADSILLVMRSGQTTREALARCCDVLNQASVPVLGIVVNDVNFRSSGAYYYGYYPELAKKYYHDAQNSA